VLVDRLWPRGLAKADADFDDWIKSVAPSTELRRWYAHDPTRFAEFSTRYRDELATAGEDLASLRRAAKRGRLTLLTATKDLDTSHAAVLAEVITGR